MAKYIISCVAAIVVVLNSDKAPAWAFVPFWLMGVGLFTALDDLFDYAYPRVMRALYPND